MVASVVVRQPQPILPSGVQQARALEPGLVTAVDNNSARFTDQFGGDHREVADVRSDVDDLVAWLQQVQ